MLKNSNMAISYRAAHWLHTHKQTNRFLFCSSCLLVSNCISFSLSAFFICLSVCLSTVRLSISISLFLIPSFSLCLRLCLRLSLAARKWLRWLALRCRWSWRSLLKDLRTTWSKDCNLSPPKSQTGTTNRSSSTYSRRKQVLDSNEWTNEWMH